MPLPTTPALVVRLMPVLHFQHLQRHLNCLHRLLWSMVLLACLPALAFDLQGHRGARGLAPENTLAGFRTALAVGVTTLELDLVLSRDGELVVSHDLRLNPDIVRDKSGAWLEGPAPGPAVHDLSLAELQIFDVGRLRPGSRYAALYPEQQPVDGERMPTLAQVVALVQTPAARHVWLNIETKLNPLQPEASADPEIFARTLVDALRRHGMTRRVSVQSFDWRTLAAVRALAPELPLVALTARLSRPHNLADPRWTAGLKLQDYLDSVPRLVQAIGAATWSPFHGDLTPETLAEAQALKLRVVPWTVNDAAVIERLLDWGVDGLISDHPERVRAALARRGQPLPATVKDVDAVKAMQAKQAK